MQPTSAYLLSLLPTELGDEPDISGVAIPLGTTEPNDYTVREGCFFGNLFTEEGVFAGNDAVWLSSNSSSRECALGDRQGLRGLSVGIATQPIQDRGIPWCRRNRNGGQAP